MTRLSIIALKVGLLNFAIGWTMGAWLLAAKGAPYIHPGFDLLHGHVSMMTLGAMAQIVFAVAYWILPRDGRERPRPGFAAASLVVLNLAAWVGVMVHWTLYSIVLALISALLFLIHAWPRIRPFGAVIPKKKQGNGRLV
jgi:hypothetical protein